MGTVYEGISLGSGGGLAALAGAGHICYMSESGHLTRRTRILAASGGAFPGLMWASGLSPYTMSKICVTRDLRCLATWSQNPFVFFRRRLFGSDADRRKNSRSGLYDSSGAGMFCHEISSTIPEPLAIVTVIPTGEAVVCDSAGVFLHAADGQRHQLSTRPANLAAATQASCAILEFIMEIGLAQLLDPVGAREYIRSALLVQGYDFDAVETIVKGIELSDLADSSGIDEVIARIKRVAGFEKAVIPASFHDGAFSRYGACPAELLTRQYGLDPKKIVAFMPDGIVATVLREVYFGVRRIRPAFPWLPYSHHTHRLYAGLVIEPKIHLIGPLNFHLSRKTKLKMIFAGVRETHRQLRAAGEEVLTDEEEHAVMVRLWKDAGCPPPFGFNPYRYGKRRKNVA